MASASSDELPEFVSGRALGAMLGITDRWVRELEKQGVLTKAGRGKYVLGTSVQSFIAWRLRTEVEKRDGGGRDSLRERREAEIAQRMAMRDRELIDIDEHDAVLDEVLGLVVAAMVGMPARVTRDRDLRKKIETEIDGAFNKASSRLKQRGAELRARGQADISSSEDDT